MRSPCEGGPMPHACPRLVGERCQPRIGGQSLDGIARRKVECRHQRPRGRYPPDALDTLPPLGGRRPRRILPPFSACLVSSRLSPQQRQRCPLAPTAPAASPPARRPRRWLAAAAPARWGPAGGGEWATGWAPQAVEKAVCIAYTQVLCLQGLALAQGLRKGHLDRLPGCSV